MSFSEKKEDAEHQKGEKRRNEDEELDEVHSANNWEEANLGDNDRRSKFLRLMGANKKQHSGRFIIGDKTSKHGRSDDETSRLSRQLEHQYQSGLDLKLSGAARHHSGLGFQPEERKALLWQQPPPPSEHQTPQCKDLSDSTAADDKDSRPPEVTASGSKEGDDSGISHKPACSKSEQTNGKGDSATASTLLGLKLNFVKSSS